ncbi:SDR family oxidoreductase [Alicyclobacillus sp. SO9]|uniref:SDR family oxidoreductase n=1 Tax=Alicyclobacillus sp. SO9 TaxID=2665646 RepID=UPI0018E8E722|nr:SDR family oxidoreductase [Alicyclobacillus sp. SO9]QQE77569.1 SDR family oxidoreductase [Alicyclobacillus sp. SO9]
MSVFDLFDLTGKVAVITGGGRGLGAQIAQAYAEAGAKVVLCSRKVANCEHLASQLVQAGKDALALELNLTNPNSIQSVVDESIQKFGKIDILVNNAGASWGAPALDMPYEAWQKVIQTNLTGTFLMSQATARHMKEQGRGKILNIASTAGLSGTPPEVLDAVGYNASKGGVVMLTKDLAVKWARYNIYVNAIAPGFFPTKMTKDVLQANQEAIINAVPLRRLGGERDLQGAALYFASAASDYTTGQVLSVDGGALAQ